MSNYVADGRIMKTKFLKISALLVLVLLVVIFPVTEVQAETDVAIVYAQVPAEWENPCIWAWGDEGVNAFEAWPGQLMTKDATNEGWYYTYVPSFVNTVIINANEGAIQTADLTTESKDIWLTVTDSEKTEVSFEQKTKGDLPEYVPMFTINAQVPKDWTMPSLWAWSAPDGTNVFANWPGQELTASEDGWYSYQIPAWVNNIIINGNLGEVQTSDIAVENKDVWITITDAETYDVVYEKPQSEVIEEELFKVHAKLPADWLLPSLWAWSAPDGTNVFVNWPGQEMETEGDWYTYSIPTWVNSIILNGNLGEVQTTDITVEPKDVWVTVTDAETYEVVYEEPAVSDTVPADTVEPTQEPTNEVDTDTGNTNNIMVIAVVVILLLVIAGGGIYVYNKKK